LYAGIEREHETVSIRPGYLDRIIAPLSLFRRRYMKKMGIGEGSFYSPGAFGPKGVEYYCINCGTKHPQIACPNCGSKMKKAGFGT
jgi:hypothetical protein